MKINDLEPTTILKCIHTCIENCKSLYNSAILLRDGRNYGIANSVLILCAEECIKTFTLYNYFANRTNEYNIDEYFKLHKVKLNLADNGFIKIASYVRARFEAEKEYLKSVPNAKESDDLPNEYQNMVQDKMNLYIEDSKYDDFWLKQNEVKQNGFYVGIDNKGEINNPLNITREKFEETNEKVKPLLMLIYGYAGVSMRDYNINAS